MRQLCNLIPTHLVTKLARAVGVAEKTRTFTLWSHAASLIFAQITHAIGLNDVCDALRLNSGLLSAIRRASGPSKNGFSTTNREWVCRKLDAFQHPSKRPARSDGVKERSFSIRWNRFENCLSKHPVLP